jgi:hypothetical protein
MLIAVHWDAYANSTPSWLEPAAFDTSACPRQHLVSGWGWWWKTNHCSIGSTTYITKCVYPSACYTRAHVIVAVSVQMSVHECLWHIQEQDGQLYEQWNTTHWPSMHEHFSLSKCMDNYVHQHGMPSSITLCTHTQSLDSIITQIDIFISQNIHKCICVCTTIYQLSW